MIDLKGCVFKSNFWIFNLSSKILSRPKFLLKFIWNSSEVSRDLNESFNEVFALFIWEFELKIFKLKVWMLFFLGLSVSHFEFSFFLYQTLCKINLSFQCHSINMKFEENYIDKDFKILKLTFQQTIKYSNLFVFM